MFVGALPLSNPYVKRLMMIRKELSIISGFPVVVHIWVRWGMGTGTFEYFFGSGEAVVRSGAVYANIAYLLGAAMSVLFLILWITSFDFVHRWLGGVRWKKVQWWSYVLYAMMFAHSILLSVSRLVGGGRGGHGGHGGGGGRGGRGGREMAQQVGEAASQVGEAIRHGAEMASGGGGHGGGGGSNATTVIGIISVCLIFGTYLFLRIRKARKDASHADKKV
jgi:DMSO/TMAO reductase YedYZ heme-binding membrane subunit